MDPRHGDETFSVLGDPPFSAAGRYAAVAELRAAGVPRGAEEVVEREVELLATGSDAQRMASAGVYVPSAIVTAQKEWVPRFRVEADVYGWRLTRAWYYWVASTERFAVPLLDASVLHERFGQQVRVDGNCGCPAPEDEVGCYHVDAPAGLRALVNLLGSLHDLRERLRVEERLRKYGF